MALARIPAYGPQHPVELSAFTAGITGTVIRPEDPAFEAARKVTNSRFDHRPALIVRVANAADVARSIVFARDNSLEIAVRGGSHSVAGHSTVEGGIVIDLGELKGLHIDPERKLAWAGAGLTAGEVTNAAAAHGLAIPFGDTATVGIGGLTLGGGIGWLVRKYGLAIDALVSVELVTADGRIVVASEQEHSDLFWAVRGGGGNFGVVTRFQFRLYPVGMVLAGALFMPPTRDVLRALGPIASSAPAELSTISFLMPAPPAPFIPAEMVGQPTLAIMFVYAGDPANGQAAIEPFRQVATPMAEMVAPMPYPGIYEFTKQEGEHGPFVTRSVFLETLDEAAIDTILDAHAAPSGPFSMTQIRILGGAMADVPADATAFAHRDAHVMVAILAIYQDPAETPVHEAWAARYFAALQPAATGVYSNFLEDEGEGRIRDAYPEATYARLADVKRRYDPSNVFHRNQNIRPATEA
jgi:FAD/FMN-containing dehydrogenase